MSPARDMRKGSTTVLILSLVAERPMYGYQIAKELERRSDGYFDFKEGTLYPALHRMEKEGLLRGEWQVVAEGPSRKYYHITEKGKRALHVFYENEGMMYASGQWFLPVGAANHRMV